MMTVGTMGPVPRFGQGNQPLPQSWLPNNQSVGTYATPVEGGSKFLKLYTTPDPSGMHSWFFAHRQNANAAIHVIPVIKDAQGNEFIHVIIQKSPIMGGRPIVQMPAGMWGDNDPNESAGLAAVRELKEETGYSVKGQTRIINNQFFATSPGMTTEMKGMALANATGTPSDKYREPSEQHSIVGSMDVPVDTILDYDKFLGWIKAQEAKGYTVGTDILLMRAMLPPTAAGRNLDIQA